MTLKIKNILISQPQPTDFEKSPYGEIARKYGVNITFRKFFKIEGIPAKDFRKDRVNILDYSAVIFSSRNAVDHYFRMCKEMRIEVPETMKYFCISESTAYYLQKYVQFRKRKIFHSKENAANLIELIKKHKTEKFLIPCSDVHKHEITKLLEDQKIHYNKAIIYKTLAADLSDLNINDFDVLVFFSPAGIKSLVKNFPGFEQNAIFIGAFGATTQKAVRDSGFTVNIEAPTQAAASMTMAIDLFLHQESKKK